ncbi:MAG: endonuclease/exonuclease/phosphatase family protein [Sneathiellaceae bacterium]
MHVTLASYNIHFGVGQDGRYDLGRLGRAVADADILCLQEVTQHWPQTGHEDQLAVLAGDLDRHAVFGPMLSLDASDRDAGGRIRHRRATFGNAILSRWPIRHARTLLLPKRAQADRFDLQRVALEAVIDLPGLSLRVYCVHLSDISAARRRGQVGALRRMVAEAPATGRPWDHTSAFMEFLGHGPFDMPEAVAMLGDFNFTPAEANYRRLLAPLGGRPFLVDAWERAAPAAAARTYALGPESDARIDYCFLGGSLVDRAERAWIDSGAEGSDHYPLFVSLRI